MRIPGKRAVLIALLLLLAAPQIWALVPERRPDTTTEEFGWLVAPTPFRIEGIGQAVPIFALISNFYETADLIAIQTLPGGDLEATGAFVDEVPVFTRHLLFGGGRFKGEFPFSLWNRGIDSDPDDFIQLSGEQTGTFFEANLFFWEQRLEAFYQLSDNTNTTLKVFDVVTP